MGINVETVGDIEVDRYQDGVYLTEGMNEIWVPRGAINALERALTKPWQSVDELVLTIT
jgi:hypothetical protein